MKSYTRIFESRWWLPGWIFLILLFAGLTAYCGYLIWQNAQTDTENIQQVREFQAASSNALFFSRKAVSGDSTAIDPLLSTVDLMDATVGQLQQADDFTKDMLRSEYDNMLSLWRNVDNSAEALGQIEYVINLMNAVADKMAVVATSGSALALASVADLSAQNAPNYQIDRAQQQALLLGGMAANLDDYVTSEKANRAAFESYREKLRQFEKNHSDLVNGNSAEGLRPVTSRQIRNQLIEMNDLLEGVRGAEPYIAAAFERLSQARDSQSEIVSNFEDLQFSLDAMTNGISGFAAERFPRPIHALILGVLLILSIIGLIVYQRVSSRIELDREHEESQKSQTAILRLLDELVDLADGDLTVTATVTEDFTGAIADSINFTIDQLRQLVSRINSTAVQVSQAAQGTQQTALHLAEASDHQAQEIAGASAAINEMAVTIDQVSANASESALVAGKSVSIANNGAKLVQNTIHGMDTIREQIQDTSKRIKRLGESSQEIGDIVSLINDIADQTNILALNAAIQASMAGDAGRGFAVVADEVQRLAERSAAATKQIETLVKTIQTDTNEAVISMEQTTSEVVRGARLAQDAGVALEEIETVSANLAELIQNISNAARQQASSAGHISNTMNVIQEITSQTSTGTSATAQSIGNLASMALALRESVADFTLPADMAADLQGQAMADIDMKVPTLTAEDSNIDQVLEELQLSDDEAAQSEAFFDSLAEEGDDLLSEFDVDLSELDFAEDDHKAAR